ncbi:hypothetical protein QIS74_02385 [Colletotrichum tabaci]|uniref:Zinc finger PHD-type domain-containing protein n=1 Tax=Colletotrichum tabaci TaxID=1209068 RepID=A0AAV9TTA8_9PEZI
MTLPSRRQRSTPFLQRNILQGMGNTQSSAQKAAASGDVPNGHNDGRPTKRRCFDADHQLADQIFQARDVGDLQRNLRVQVNRIFHKASKRVAAASSDDVVNLKARCKVSLSHVTNAGDVLLYCNSQLCDIRSFKDPGGPYRMARIGLPRPFYIPEDSMRINRDDDGSFDLADSYRLCVELEAAGPTFWPPIIINNPSGDDHASSRQSDTIHWVLTAASSDLFSRRRTLLNLKVKKSPQLLAPTDHVIDVDASWATAFEAGQIRAVESGVEPSITVSGQDTLVYEATDTIIEPPYESPPGTPVRALSNSYVNGDAHGDEEAEEELTPNRSLRVRGATKNYNLKVLSDKAQGKDKKRKKRGAANAVEEGSVTYYLPSEKVCLDSYRCITCGMPHGSFPQLHAHLISLHDEYEYRPQSRTKGAEFEVAHRYETYSFGPEPFALRRPTKAFDLDQFAEGNLSFVTSRFETEDKSTAGAPPLGGRPSRQPLTKPAQAPSKLIIPDIGQPLYDPITRAELQPGTEYRKPEASHEWLIQWHRDALADFSDVPPDEMEYMQEWDKFMLAKRITSNIYFSPAWLSFVKIKSDWLLSSPSRMLEFGKHLTYLLVRGSLDHETVEEALKHIAACRKRLGMENGKHPAAAPKEPPQGPHVRKSAGGCQVCGLVVLGPRLLLCANSDCAKRLYHSDCIRENAKMNVEDPDWVCNQCFDTQVAEHI